MAIRVTTVTEERRDALVASADIIGAKWTALLIYDLANGARRFRELEHSCAGISSRTLAERLRALERAGIVRRYSYPESPPRVEYELTEKGEALLPVVLALRQWGEDWGHGCQEIFLADKQDGKPVRRICVQAHDGRELKLGDMMWVDKATGATVKHPHKGKKKAARSRLFLNHS